MVDFSAPSRALSSNALRCIFKYSLGLKTLLSLSLQLLSLRLLPRSEPSDDTLLHRELIDIEGGEEPIIDSSEISGSISGGP